MALPRVLTDCQSLVKWINKPRPRMSHTSATTLLGVARDLSRSTATPVGYCKAHVERRTRDVADWTFEETGNYLADRAASGDETAILELYPQAHIISESILTASLELLDQADWHLTLTSGSPCTPSLRAAQQAAHSKEYTRLRDSRHNDDDPLWKHASVQHAAAVWGLTHLSQVQRARANRIIYNKHWFPWNTARYGLTFDDIINDGLCPLCGELDSLAHLIFLCNDVTCRRVRRYGRRTVERVMETYDTTETGGDMNVAMNAVIWNGPFASAWTGVWHQHQRDRLIVELDRVQSPLMVDNKIKQKRAAAQLRDVNLAMAATLSS